MKVGILFLTVSSTQTTNASYSWPVSVAHSPVVPKTISPLTPSSMRRLTTRSVSARSTVSTASQRSAPSFAGVGMMA